MKYKSEGNYSFYDKMKAWIRYNFVKNNNTPLLFSKVADKLYIGRAPRTPDDIYNLNKINIGATVTVQMEYEISYDASEYGSSENLILHVPDMSCPTQQQYHIANKFIGTQLYLGKNVFIQCNAGHGRSAAVLANYLQKARKFTPDQTCTILKSKRIGINCKCIH